MKITTVLVGNVKFEIGKLETFNVDDYDELTWYGITHIVTTITGMKIFYVAIDYATRAKVRDYLKAMKVNPSYITDFLLR